MAAVTLALAAGTPIAAQSGAIAGTVFDSLRARMPVRDATVMIVELARTASTDTRGRFRFDSVPAGRYNVTFFSAILDSLGMGAPTATVTVSGGGQSETWLALPSPADLYRRLCGPPRDQQLGVVVGRVRDVDSGQPIAAATVETFWAEFEYVDRAFRRRLLKATTRSGPQGSYILCGVPSDLPLDLTARSGVFQAGPLTVSHDRDVVLLRDITVSVRDSAARADTTVLVRDSAAVPRGTGIVRGRVRERTGRPVADAPVRVVADARETRSGPDGSFTLVGVPAGSRMVEGRAIGYGPATSVADVPTNGTVAVEITFDRRAQEMKAITIIGQRRRPEYSGFSERMSLGAGRFIDETEMRRRPVARIGDAIRRGGNVTYDMTSIGPELKMRPTGSMSNDSRCTPNFYLDGAYIAPPSSVERQTLLQMIESLVLPEDVIGIEMYASLGTVPAQFDRGNNCGAIVIWTR